MLGLSLWFTCFYMISQQRIYGIPIAYFLEYRTFSYHYGIDTRNSLSADEGTDWISLETRTALTASLPRLEVLFLPASSLTWAYSLPASIYDSACSFIYPTKTWDFTATPLLGHSKILPDPTLYLNKTGIELSTKRLESRRYYLSSVVYLLAPTLAASFFAPRKTSISI